MNKIQNNLYIGGVYDFNDEITSKTIDIVIKLYSGKHGKYPSIPSSMKILDFPAIDGGHWEPEYFRTVTANIHEQLATGKNVMITCAAGKSRSSVMSIAYLMVYQGYNLEDAYKLVKKARPNIDPSMYLLLSLMEWLSIHPYISSVIGK